MISVKCFAYLYHFYLQCDRNQVVRTSPLSSSSLKSHTTDDGSEGLLSLGGLPDTPVPAVILMYSKAHSVCIVSARS